MRTSTRTLLAAGGAALASALALATPASADVTVTPTQLTEADSTSVTRAQPVQGAAARLAFTVTSSSRTASTTKVQVLLPVDTPIAEVYPLSAPGWAPGISEKGLDKPLQGVHGGRIDRVATAITWTAMPGRAVGPGKSSVLQVEAGPMPAADQIVLQLVQTYSDGTVTRSDATVKLSPPTGTAAQGHNHAGTGTGTTGDDASAGSASDSSDKGSGGGTKLALILSVLVVGLLGGAVVGGFALPRLRRGASALTVSREELDKPAEGRTAG